ncbi:ATP-binding protein [Streptomyces rhizosphaericus]|uniref:ATP-binding protein n=1 Tax=Streptomyces rhizosphaericus TaxID=114699 RepID=A0A6G4AUD5_9ACTN|nr:ATP-binding protein [Streptomyces rhizosphaericus]NEW77086.1 ATP-binding protein [Streptomyces rhizosphaericus]
MSQVQRVIALINDEKAPREARRAVRHALFAWEYGEGVADVATLLASELVTNAIRHAPDSIRVKVRFAIRGEVLAIEVHDESPAMPVWKAAAVDAESGRGLGIIDAVAAEHGGRCGFRPDAHGKWVFVTLKVPPVPKHVHARELAGSGAA